MHKFLVVLAAAFIVNSSIGMAAPSPAEQQVAQAVEAPGLTGAHLWAPWCSNCQAELKSGGWTKMVNDNPEVKFLHLDLECRR